ncbi:MAG TPA: serine protease, partial [Cyanobacteria bacterium UBA8530]|nr:serine protease [Cyanobacteria bacterium UBA8530]
NIGKAAGNPDGTANTIFGMWMNSSGHKANILNTSYGKIGIGAVQTGSTTYFTQVFTN